MTTLKIERLNDGRLMAQRDGEPAVSVYARRCFPWHQAQSYITLRDMDDNEIALIRDLHELDPVSREAIQAALAEAAFVLEIVRINSIETELEIRNWSTLTRQGSFRFQTRLDTWPETMPNGDLLIRDITGNLLRINNPKQMDKASQKLLWGVID